jgi:putative MFS transporter
VYLVGIVPLLVLAWARRDLRETKRFEATSVTEERSLFYFFSTPYRGRLLKLAAVWAVAYIASQNAVAFWKEFAVAERGLTDGQVGAAIALASVTSMPLVFGVGPLIDAIGRRRGAAIVFSLGAIGTFLSYTLHGQWPLTGALVLGVFGVSAYLPILNAYNNELFPTHLRGDAYAWANNLLGRISYVLAPLAVGFLAQRGGGFGPIVSVTPIFTIFAMVLVLAWFPETKDRELEETAAV